MKTRKKASIGFWDTSVIVPLCCQQNLSQTVRKLWRETDHVVVWWGTTVEVRSAISRLHRGGVITVKGRQQALARLELLRREWYEITPSEQARRLAEDLPDTYGLRALDSFQLAAALVWCREKPRNRTFVCDDARLAASAEAVGFTVVP